MDRAANLAENKNLTRYIKADADFRDVNITQSVMNRIYRLNDESSKDRRRKPLRRSAVVAMISVVMLLGTLTAYAAKEYVQIRDSKGRTVIEAVEAGPMYSSYPKAVSEQFEAYRQRVIKQLQPGQMLAYYINDDKLNVYDKASPIKFEFNGTYDSYRDYLEKLRHIQAPQLKMPEYLPQGYVFRSGTISPRPPMRGDKDHSAYDQLQQKLLEKAAATKGTERLIVEPVEWTSTLGVSLNISNGSSFINVMAQTGPDNPAHGERATVSQAATATSETVRIGDQEVLYMNDRSPEADLPHYLSWYNERSNIYYTIMDSKDSKLDRETMLQMAESMMKQANN